MPSHEDRVAAELVAALYRAVIPGVIGAAVGAAVLAAALYRLGYVEAFTGLAWPGYIAACAAASVRAGCSDRRWSLRSPARINRANPTTVAAESRGYEKGGPEGPP